MKSDGKSLQVRPLPQAAAEQGVSAQGRSADDPLDQIVWYIGRAYYAYVGLLERVLAETGMDRHVRPGMGHILFALFEEDGRSIKEIAARTQLSGSTLTGMLARMVSAGLVERRRDEKDGRVVRVRLTDLGRSLEPGCRLVVQKLGEILRAGMAEEDLRQARRLLRRLTETLRAEDRRKSRSR